MVIQVPHEVGAIPMQKAAKYLTPARYSFYEASILSNLEVMLEVRSVLNLATLLPDLERDETLAYSCIDLLEEKLPLRKDLTDKELVGVD